jgi:hypothetical protein
MGGFGVGYDVGVEEVGTVEESAVHVRDKKVNQAD